MGPTRLQNLIHRAVLMTMCRLEKDATQTDKDGIGSTEYSLGEGQPIRCRGVRGDVSDFENSVNPARFCLKFQASRAAVDSCDSTCGGFERVRDDY
jgi:hypothetical protein